MIYNAMVSTVLMLFAAPSNHYTISKLNEACEYQSDIDMTYHDFWMKCERECFCHIPPVKHCTPIHWIQLVDTVVLAWEQQLQFFLEISASSSHILSRTSLSSSIHCLLVQPHSLFFASFPCGYYWLDHHFCLGLFFLLAIRISSDPDTF